MSGRQLKVDLVANTSQFKSAMAETAANMRTIKSEMRATASETDKFGNRVQNNGTRIRQLNSLMTEYRTRIKAIKDEQRHLTNEYKKGNITEKQHANAQRELANRLNNTKAAMNRTEAELKKLNAQGKNARRTFQDFDKSFRNVGTSMRNVGLQAGITAGVGFTAMKRIMGSVIEEANEFHQGMAEVKAISGATDDELAKLTNQAKELGRTTKYTAHEAAEAMANLARAGFKVNEIYDAMPGLLDLAASSNIDLGQASNITANILRTFNKDASESAKVADVLAKGAATANTDVSGLGESMKTAGPVAQSLGIQFESVAAATGLMADAGIDGSSAGRMLRQGMLRLSKPTGEAGKLIKELGINVFDADGNMKSLDKVVGELNKGLQGQTKQQKAAALATLFGSESTAGWTVLLDQGADSLSDYTNELIDSEGAAKDMADTMQDTAEGAITRMNSAISGLKIELGEKLAPIIVQVADGVGDFANKLSEMDSATIETIATTGLLVTAVLGVTTAVAGLVAGIGAFMAFAGPVGVAITAGVGALGLLGVAIHNTNKKSKEASEVNLDVAKSLTDEAMALEEAANTFDKLSSKAKISNAELAELNDLNKRISESSNPGEIEQLQKQYEKLAEKSGLSKDELNELFTANDTLIKQSPDVETSISNQGNAFVESTEKVREYIDSLLEASMTELRGEREKQLQRQNELQDELIKKERQLGDMQEALVYTDELRGKSKEELLELDAQLTEQMNEAKAGSEEWLALDEKRTALNAAMNGNAEEYYFQLIENIKEQRKSVDLTKEELAELDKQTQALADVYMQQVGITEQGAKGLTQLDKAIAKNDEEIAKLEEKKQKNGELSESEQQRYNELTETVEKQREHRDIIHDELGIYKDLNSLAEAKMEKTDANTQKIIESLAKTTDIKVEEGNIIKQLETQNSEIDKKISNLEKEKEKQGANTKEINNQIKEQQEKRRWNDAIIEQILKELGVWEQVKDSIGKGVDEEKKKGKATDDTTKKQKNQGDQIDKNNKKTDTGIKKEKERSKEASRDVDKNVNVSDKGKTDEINRKAGQTKNKAVKLYQQGLSAINIAASTPRRKRVSLFQSGLAEINRQASQSVTKTVRLNVTGMTKSLFGYEKGTPPSGHPGGDFIAGEAGRELVRLPSGKTFLTPDTTTFYPNMPKGTHVIPNRKTEQILRNTPRYANGTPNWDSIKNNLSSASTQLITQKEILTIEHEINNDSLENKITSLENTVATLTDTLITLTQTQHQQMKTIAEREMIVEMDSEKVGKATQKSVNKKTDDETKMKLQMLGII